MPFRDQMLCIGTVHMYPRRVGSDANSQDEFVFSQVPISSLLLFSHSMLFLTVSRACFRGISPAPALGVCLKKCSICKISMEKCILGKHYLCLRQNLNFISHKDRFPNFLTYKLHKKMKNTT